VHWGAIDNLSAQIFETFFVPNIGEKRDEDTRQTGPSGKNLTFGSAFVRLIIGVSRIDGIRNVRLVPLAVCGKKFLRVITGPVDSDLLRFDPFSFTRKSPKSARKGSFFSKLLERLTIAVVILLSFR